MKRRLLIFLSMALLMASCQKENTINANQTLLLSAQDSVPSISLDFSKTSQELESQIRSITSAQDQKKPLHFGLLVDGVTYNASIHAAHSVIPACYGMPAMQHRSPQLEVNLNFPSMVLMEGKHLISLDSIPGFINWYYPNDKPYGEKIVKLTWQEDSTPEAIENTIGHIAEGYLNFYEKESYLRYQKPVCDLDSTELKAISKKYPFELRLWVGDPDKTYPPVLTPKGRVTKS